MYPIIAAATPLVTALSGIIGLAILACWIMEIIAAFKNEKSPLMGILSIVLCGIGGLIIGWIHAKKWGIQKIMLIWTVLIIVNILISLAFGFSALPTGAPGTR